MNKSFLTLLWILQDVFILVGVIIFLITPANQKGPVRELGFILIVAWLVESATLGGYFIFRTNMNIAPNLYDLINLPLGLLFYSKKIHWKNIKTVTYILIAVFLLFGLSNLFFIQGLFGFNGYLNTVASVVYIITAIVYFYVLIQQLPTEKITRLPMFWINTGFLFYYSGIFLINLAVDFLIKRNDDLVVTWILHNLIGLVFYALLWVGLWLNKRQKPVVATP